ncbi:HAMP domain-containing sensor histidine kinase [Microbacterium pumilum]|uniref:Sensor-like histidine kinase SenX3 n=1 Tax=Microbacterium pumilum TaxID=344165 RepID=A0ABN2SY69_9MICO
MSALNDERRVRQTSMRVGLWVGAASTLILAAGVGVLILVIFATARPERGGPGRGHADFDDVVVDVDRVVPWVIALGVLGVVLLALVAWFAARRSVRPLAEALRMQRNFVSDASHELRTPLTALTSRIQILQRRHDRGEPIDETIVDLRRNAAVMDDVLTDMLLSAEADAAQTADPTDVAACVAAAAQSLRPMATERDVAVDVEVDGRPAAAIPRVTLTRLCVALLDNAIVHAPSGTTVGLSARAVGGSVELRVVDRGTGIRAEDVDRIFERFARADETGNRRGFGLGLALVREAVTRYGGSVSIESTSSAGTTFLVVLPSA